MQRDKIILSLFLFFFPGNLCHATEFTATIEKILVYGDGALVYVFPVGGVPGAPACHGKNGDYLSFSLTRPHAKEYYAGLLIAFSSGKSVLFRGRNTCTDQSFSETLDYFM